MQQLVMRLGRRGEVVFDPVDAFAQNEGLFGPDPRPRAEVAYVVVAQDVGGVRQPVSSPLRLVTVRNASGYDVFFGFVEETGTPGQQRPLAPGDYRVRITSPLYQAREVSVTVPMPDPQAATPVALSAGYAYPFPIGRRPNGQAGLTLLRGSLQQADGSGIADATVGIAGQPKVTYRTDESGQWVLVFPDPDLPPLPSPPAGRPPVTPFAVTVVFDWTDAAGTPVHREVAGVSVLPGATTGFPQQSLGGVTRTKLGAVVAGAVLMVVGFNGTVLSAANGDWLYCFEPGQPPAGPVIVKAELAGSSLTQTVVVKAGKRTLVPPFEF